MDLEIKKDITSNWFKMLQEAIWHTITNLERKDADIKTTVWNRSKKRDEGGGEFRILENGKIFDKVGVNFSKVHGKFPKQFQKNILGAKKNHILIVFILVSFALSFIGYFFGTILATISTNLLASQEIVDLFDINLSFYGIEGFPIIFSYSYFIIISLFTFFMIFTASFLPTSFYLNKNVEELIVRDNK